MSTSDQPAEEFQRQRPHLRAVALRVLGTGPDADDAVQEAWLRLNRQGDAGIDNLGGWLTTVVARIALDMLRARTRRPPAADPVDVADDASDAAPNPEEQALLADSVGAALLLVLDTLTPAERLAFVLHDTFDVPFDEIATVLGRSTAATKMLASRARRKVQGRDDVTRDPDPGRQREVVDAFLAAARHGEFETLVGLLHPDVELAADAAAVRMGSPESLTGAAAVAGMFSGRALGAQPAVVDGAVGMAWIVDGAPRVVWDVIVEDGRVVHIDMLAAPETLRALDLEPLPG
ncbi:MAG: sigma-70 family RNA polymerase sigma factor [Acidimicrobiia bacterium]